MKSQVPLILSAVMAMQLRLMSWSNGCRYGTSERHDYNSDVLSENIYESLFTLLGSHLLQHTSVG
jgi:hypothetical protein